MIEEDVQLIAELKRLRALDIRDNAIGDIRLLAGLVALRTLLIQGNLIRDLRPLSGLTLTDFRYDVSDEIPPIGTSGSMSVLRTKPSLLCPCSRVQQAQERPCLEYFNGIWRVYR